MLSPLLETQSQGDCPPSGHPAIFFANGTQTAKTQFVTIAHKIENRKISSLQIGKISDFRPWEFANPHGPQQTGLRSPPNLLLCCLSSDDWDDKCERERGLDL